MAQKCGCDDTCEYSPGKIRVPSIPEDQNVTMEYLAAQQWVSLRTLIENIGFARIQ